MSAALEISAEQSQDLDPEMITGAVLALAVAVASETCRSGRHRRTPETTYEHPRTGRRACRPCLNERRRWREAERAAGREPVQPRRTRVPNPLPAAEVERLRALVACLGCGAVRRGYQAKDGPRTRIRHRKSCPVRRNRESEPRRRTVARRAKGPGGLPGPVVEPQSSLAVGNAEVTLHEIPTAGRSAEGVTPCQK